MANANLFAELMETVKLCSLGKVTNAREPTQRRARTYDDGYRWAA